MKSYQVLARKWRPRSFEAMVGQEHVLRMLINALDNQRLHHAYLFTGTRGVGKTTLGRLLAKCLNCETGVTSKPCGQCSACQAVDAGRFLDLIEVDGASRTKVEDTRELLENVQYAPTQGRYKIYLIDEVHMLSGHSFNALLKTLEEPPEHVKFILATTDPKRLPITILSRCLQFNLKRVPAEKIAKQLQFICTSENIKYENPALELLSRAADGSVRDALSLLDQAIAFCQQTISTLDVQQMLGSIEQDHIFRLLNALANQDGKKLLEEMTSLAELAPDFNQALEDLLSILHQMSLLQVVAEFPEQNATIKQLATLFSAEDVQLYYQIALIGRRDLPLAPNPQHGFEMIMLRMLAFKPAAETVAMPVTKTKVLSTPPPVPREEKKPETKKVSGTWPDILPQLELSGLAHALASNCTLVTMTTDKISLALSAQHEPLFNKKLTERIEQALSQHFNQPIKLDINITTEVIDTPAKAQQQAADARHANATEAIQGDAHVKKLMDLFGATLDVSSIKAVDS